MNEDLKKHYDLVVASSMLNWWPKIKGLDIPQPKTKIVGLSNEDRQSLWGLLDMKELPKALSSEILEVANSIGYPLFMRSDQGSGKHQWNHTCFVKDRMHLFGQLTRLVEWHETLFPPMPFGAIIFREYIDMDSKFCAFEGLPISPERRYFINNGDIVDSTSYWPEDSIRFYKSTKEYEDLPWRDLLEEMNKETPEEIELLTKYALEVARFFKDYWSVDFCRSLNSKWYLIDMARGEVSWNPKKDKEAATELLEQLDLGDV